MKNPTSYLSACKILKRDPNKKPKVGHMPKFQQAFHIAMHEITTIIEAVNFVSGFKVDWANSDQRKWRCWFERTLNKKGSFSGFAFASSGYGGTNTAGGSRFALGSQADSDYVGKKFIKTWNKILT